MTPLAFEVPDSFMFFCPLTGAVILAPGIVEASDATVFIFDAAAGHLVANTAACAAIRDEIVSGQGGSGGSGSLPGGFWERFSRTVAGRMPCLVVFAFTRRPAPGERAGAFVYVGIDFAHIDPALAG